MFLSAATIAHSLVPLLPAAFGVGGIALAGWLFLGFRDSRWGLLWGALSGFGVFVAAIILASAGV